MLSRPKTSTGKEPLLFLDKRPSAVPHPALHPELRPVPRSCHPDVVLASSSPRPHLQTQQHRAHSPSASSISSSSRRKSSNRISSIARPRRVSRTPEESRRAAGRR